MKHLFFLIFLATTCISISAQDWPDWRGVNRDGVWNESGIVETFEADTIAHKWSVEIGSGYSGPTVANGKVYVTDRFTKPNPVERVLCFDEETGKKIWEFSYDCEYSGVGYPAGPRASVIINNGKAYSLGTMGHFYCFDASSGEVLWNKDLNTEYEIVMPIWGIASTPLIVADKIIVQVSGSNNASIVAFNKNTGEEIWRNLNDRAGYSAPILIEKNGKKVVVSWTEHSLSGVNPETGEVYWRFPWETGYGMSIATPVLSNDHIFVSAFYSGSLLVKLGDDYTTAEKVWQRCGESERKTDALHCVMNTPIIRGEFIYGVDSYGELRCLDFYTGDRIWEDQTAVKRNRWANIHFIQHEDKIWMFNEQGELLITELSPDGFKEISRAKLIEPTKKQLPRGVCWSHPAFANKHVFIRNDKQLICADLSKK
jgi:outer membrane protein assembly factor BamB